MLSDHADWPGLLQTIEASGCESVGATHGYTGTLARYLSEQGLDADEIATRYVGEQDLEPADPGTSNGNQDRDEVSDPSGGGSP